MTSVGDDWSEQNNLKLLWWTKEKGKTGGTIHCMELHLVLYSDHINHKKGLHCSDIAPAGRDFPVMLHSVITSHLRVTCRRTFSMQETTTITFLFSGLCIVCLIFWQSFDIRSISVSVLGLSLNAPPKWLWQIKNCCYDLWHISFLCKFLSWPEIISI